ncbi:MAG TPA: ribose 5-phosphate isomerase B [Candidatus Uhrbacteria bacterium]|nr:ribose 5-phosphate isomerase B [Candidatus Uhrbacteria bacterium]
MKIAIANDQGGFKFREELLRFLKHHKHQPIDCGSVYEESVDYPDHAIEAIDMVLNGNADRAILICGTGIGMSIIANRFQGIRATLAYNKKVAKLSREHNNANVLCLGGRQFNSVQMLLIVDAWLTTEFSKEKRHKRRLKKIEKYAMI